MGGEDLMHMAAYAFVERAVAALGPFCSVLEIGSRNVNGGVRDLFGDCVYEGVDKEPGPGVDWVCDATKDLPSGPYDCVVCCEVFEHEQEWPRIVERAARVLMRGGALIVTAAGPGRAEHSAIDGGRLHADEWYANIEPAALFERARIVGLSPRICEENTVARDVYLAALREEVSDA